MARTAPAIPAPTESDATVRLDGVVLARLAAGPGTESEIARDVAALCGRGGAADALRLRVVRSIAGLVHSRHAAFSDGRLRATDSGHAAAAIFLGLRSWREATWTAICHGPLLAKSLGIEGQPATRLSALGKADGLRALIVEARWGLKLRGKPSAARVRAALAKVALERAFGNRIRRGLDERTELPAKASRLLAGELAAKPRDFKTDARLVAALAADAMGVRRPSLDALRQAALRKLIDPSRDGAGRPRADGARHADRGGSGTTSHSPSTTQPLDIAATPVARIVSPIANVPAQPVPDAVRPDPERFAATVLELARTQAEGFPGNRKAFVSRVWESIQTNRPEWRLSEIEFKCMLTEAHRKGLVALASADLKSRSMLPDMEASAITYKNTVWHYVRTED